MMRQQWDALRVGDGVVVHGDDGMLVNGTVAFVNAGDDTGDANSVGVRVVGTEETYYAWPSLADVHSDPIEVTEACVHCRLAQVPAAVAAAAEVLT